MTNSVVAVLVAALPLILVEARSSAHLCVPWTRTAATRRSCLPPGRSTMDRSMRLWLTRRGGATSTMDLDSDDEEYDEEEDTDVLLVDEEYDDEEQEEEKETRTLAKSAVKATVKQAAKQTKTTKQAVSAKLQPKKSSKFSLKRYVPYIVRACLNPLTVMTMTRAYMASLFNLNYLQQQDSSQDLRSALEEKAKKLGGAGGGRKGKRAMRPGQAKTLSDLPQLST